MELSKFDSKDFERDGFGNIIGIVDITPLDPKERKVIITTTRNKKYLVNNFSWASSVNNYFFMVKGIIEGTNEKIRFTFNDSSLLIQVAHSLNWEKDSEKMKAIQKIRERNKYRRIIVQ